MGIGRIGGLYQSYPVDTIKKVEPETVKQQDEIQKQQENMLSGDRKDTHTGSDKPSKMADLENISLTFRNDDTYDYIGKDSDLALLDVDQVVSDMKKDSILDQYRYFVGEDAAGSGFMEGLEGDGIVVTK